MTRTIPTRFLHAGWWLAPLLCTAFVPRAWSAPLQEVPRHGLPTRVDLPGMTDIEGGGQMTPDGRLTLRSWAYPGMWSVPVIDGWPRNQNLGVDQPILHGWAVQVVRPELITQNANTDEPEFSSAVFSPPGDGYLIEPGADLGTYAVAPIPPRPGTNVDHPLATYGNDFVNDPAFRLPSTRRGPAFPGAVASGVAAKAHTTWFPDPILDASPLGDVPPASPYACTSSGVPLDGLPAPQTAEYVAYEMIMVTFCPGFLWGQIPNTNPPLHCWTFDDHEGRVRQTPVKVVVHWPYTANATVHNAWVRGRAQELTWGASNPLFFGEVSITQDGHFLIGQGPKPLASATPGVNHFPTPGPGSPQFYFGSVIWATWNGTPGSASGWHEPVVLSEVYEHRDDVLKLVNNRPVLLREVIRLADKPMRYENGDLIGDRVVDGTGYFDPQRDASFGAYPWVHWDGDGVLYPIGGSRGTLGYCGVQTNHTFASLDAVNTSHLLQISVEEHDKSDDEHIMGGMIAMTGMWDVYRDTEPHAGRAVLDSNPAHPRDTTFGVIHAAHEPEETLTVMSFEDWSDGDYTAFLRMTPLVERIDLLTYTYGLSFNGNPNDALWTWLQLGKTADTSGNYHVASLLPDARPMTQDVPSTGAAFTVATSNARPHAAAGSYLLPFRRPVFDTTHPQTTLGQVRGRIGEGVRLGREGYIDIRPGIHTPTPASSLLSSALSIEAFVKPTAAFLAGAHGNTRLFHSPDRITVEITSANALRVSVRDPRLPPSAPPAIHTTTPTLTQSVWYHVAVTFDAGVLRCYVDGVEITNIALTPSPLPTSASNHFEIGPHGTGGHATEDVLFFVDEFRLSRIARTQDEIRRHAYVEIEPVYETNPANLPPLAGTPVRVSDCRVDPTRPWSAAKAAFGDYLFEDLDLSLNKNYSCASCHDEQQSFSDGRDRAVGHAGGLLPFSTPTILNTVTGREMFWNMRALDLFHQSTQPITTPVEMGFTDLTTVKQRLNFDSQAMLLHRLAFGGSTPLSDETIAQGLTSYMQEQIAVNTPVEQYETGTPNALTDQEKRGRALFHGKARCISCHSGPSYNDLLPHNTGASTTGQTGRQQFSHRRRDFGAFKTPTLRGINGANRPTAPYFHDGFASSLMDVIEFYDVGGGSAGANAASPGRAAIGTTDPILVRLALTSAEKDDLLAFLLALGL